MSLQKPANRNRRPAPLTLISIAVALAALSGIPRGAAADDASDVYQKYYESIQIHVLCEDAQPDAATWQKLAAYIVDQTKFSLTAGQSLTAIEAAKDQAAQIIDASGCDDRSAQQLIALYHAMETAAQ